EGAGLCRSRAVAAAAGHRHSGDSGRQRRAAQETGALAMRALLNIVHLGVKELRSLGRDTLMLALILFAFTGQVYLSAKRMPESLHKAPIAVVDEDHSPLSSRIINAF